MVFPPSYFETPFIWHDSRKQKIRQIYTTIDQLLVHLVLLSYNEGALWWFKDHPNLKFMEKTQKFINTVRWFVQ